MAQNSIIKMQILTQPIKISCFFQSIAVCQQEIPYLRMRDLLGYRCTYIWPTVPLTASHRDSTSIQKCQECRVYMRQQTEKSIIFSKKNKALNKQEILLLELLPILQSFRFFGRGFGYFCIKYLLNTLLFN